MVEREEEFEIEETPTSGSLLDSKTNQLDDELNLKLSEAFDNNSNQFDLHDVIRIATEYDPVDLAYAVTRLPAPERVIVYNNLPDLSAKTIFMINTGSSTRAAIFRQISDREIQTLIENMPPDEAVWILDDMSDRRFKRVMDLLDPLKARRILELQQHDRNSAGRLMTNEFFAFPLNSTIGEVSLQVRDNPGIDLSRYIFVLNESGELIGYVPIRTLLINPHYLPLRQVMRPILHTVTAEASRDEVVDIVERYKIPALPVVDKKNHLLGIITYEDVVEAMEDIADTTIASFAGTAEDVSEQEPVFKRIMWRAPWLLVTLCASLVSVSAMTHFYGRTWFALVPLFIPLITGMSGNVGIQCSTILVRWIATGELSYGSRREAISKEMMIGILIGVIFGILSGVLIYILNATGIHVLGESALPIVLMVGCGVFAACLTATTLGSLSPFFFARFGIDPAVASGPIVTACNDVLSTLMFFLVARLVFSLFA